jgi:hypothetical protein
MEDHAPRLKLLAWQFWWRWVRSVQSLGDLPNEMAMLDTRRNAHVYAYRVLGAQLTPYPAEPMPAPLGTYATALYEVLWMFLRNHATLINLTDTAASATLLQFVAEHESDVRETRIEWGRAIKSIEDGLQIEFLMRTQHTSPFDAPACIMENTERLFYSAALLRAYTRTLGDSADELWRDVISHARPADNHSVVALYETTKRLYTNLLRAASIGVSSAQPSMATSVAPMIEAHNTSFGKEDTTIVPHVDDELSEAVRAAVQDAEKTLKGSRKRSGISTQLSTSGISASVPPKTAVAFALSATASTESATTMTKAKDRSTVVIEKTLFERKHARSGSLSGRATSPRFSVSMGGGDNKVDALSVSPRIMAGMGPVPGLRTSRGPSVSSTTAHAFPKTFMKSPKRRSRSSSDLRAAILASGARLDLLSDEDDSDDAGEEDEDATSSSTTTSSYSPAFLVIPDANGLPVPLRSRLDAVAYGRALVTRFAQFCSARAATIQRDGMNEFFATAGALAPPQISSDRSVLHESIGRLCERCGPMPPDLTHFDTLDALTRAAERIIEAGVLVLRTDAEHTASERFGADTARMTTAQRMALRDISVMRALLQHLSDMAKESENRQFRDNDVSEETRLWQETLRRLLVTFKPLFKTMLCDFFDRPYTDTILGGDVRMPKLPSDPSPRSISNTHPTPPSASRVRRFAVAKPRNILSATFDATATYDGTGRTRAHSGLYLGASRSASQIDNVSVINLNEKSTAIV